MELKRFIIFATFLCAIKSLNGNLLPCDSTFRFLRPDLFAHCTTCRHSDWTEWNQVANSVGPDTSGKCESGEAYTETRRQYSLDVVSCQDKVETRSVCVPTQNERLSLFLGLGEPSSLVTPEVSIRPIRPISPNGRPGPDIIPQQTLSPPVEGNPYFPIRFKKDIFKRQAGRCNEGSICQHLSGKRKRATADEAASSQEDLLDLSHHNTPSHHDTPSHHNTPSMHHNPLPFIMAEDGHRFKRQTRQCAASDKQHVLFMLDISGSIGSSEFDRVKEAVANLTLLFCQEIEVAVLTFNHKFHLEFCFNCFHDTLGPYKAIKNIQYRGGSTHTAGATKCACESLLGPSCGVELATETCVDIIYITDGHSNDPNRNVCHEVKCMHNHLLKMNTYAIGIAGGDQQELDCIQEDSNNMQKFWFDTFQEFYDAMKDLYYKPKNVFC